MNRKKKITIITTVTILLIVITLPVILFSPIGNAAIAPFLEAKINAQLPLNIKLETFRLTPSQIHLKAALSETSYITADGTYGLLDKNFDINYTIHIKELAKFADAIKQDFRGPLDTHGKIKGSIENLTIHGKSDIANSETVYDITVIDSKIETVATIVKHLNLPKILYMLRQPEIIDGELDTDLKITNLNPDNLKGSITAKLKDGEINSEELSQLFDLSIPETKALFNLNADFNAGDIKYNFNLTSNPATISSEGFCKSASNSLDIKYFIDIKELAMFKTLLKRDYRGALSTKGSLKGDLDKFIIKGTGNMADGNISYRVPVINKIPKTADFTLQHVHLAKLLYMLNQPQYSDALIDMNATFSSLTKDNLSGHVTTVITEGKTFPNTLEKLLNLKDADIKYNGKIESNIKKSVAVNNIKIISNAANITADKLLYNLNTNLLESDFTLELPNLDKLYFVTNRHLKGAMTFTGDIHKDKDLIVNAHSNTLGGKLELTLKNNDLQNHFEKVKVSKILETLVYPVFFESPLTGDLFYNIKTKKGNFKAELNDGHFLKNTMTDIVAKTTKLDMTKEIYKTTLIDAGISDHIITSDLSMSSKNTKIIAKSAKIDTKNEKVDMKLQINYKDTPVNITLEGNIKKPKIGIEATELLKTKLNTIIDKKAPPKARKMLKDILKMF